MKPGLLRNAVVILLTSWLISSCGGGSGTDGGFIGGGSGSDGAGGDSGETPSITLTLVRSEGGEDVPVDRIDPNNPGTLVAMLENVDDDLIVNFSSTLGQFDPASASVLARGGEARITLEAGASSAGAGTATASITVGADTFTSNEVSFEVLEFEEVEEDLQLGICTGGSSPLDCTSPGATFVQGVIETTLDTLEGEPADGIPAQGTAEISLVVADVSTTPVTPARNVSVSITSRCTNINEASISAAQSDVNGAVTATYQANGCEETDNITATIPSSGSTATGTIFVYPSRVGSIVFDRVVDSAGDPIETIFIQESGGESTALVVFKVFDRFGDPKPDVDVRFELTTTIGGLSLQNTVRKTDDNGEAVAFVNSGFIATTVRVRATIDIDTDNDGTEDKTLVTVSDALSVNTGIADQNSMSMSVSQFSVEGEALDGQTIDVSVRMADPFDNPVRDGTTVQFRTEYGRIVSSCNTVGGDCTVTWNSQEPRRPLADNTPLGGLASCPKALIVDESVTISGVDGDTGYLAAAIGRVETTGDVGLVRDTDYTEDADGSGITCVSGSTECNDGAELRITYYRAWADEDPPQGDTDHTISNPGVATAPFVPNNLPCLVGTRAATTEVPAYLGSAGQIYGGRNTILAFAQGEESFIDSNGNGVYDEGEPFEDLPEAFLDVNEDDVFGNGTPGVDDSSDNTPEHWNCYGPRTPVSEGNAALNRCFQEGGLEDRLLDFNENGSFEEGNGIYNGTLCPLNEDGVTTPDYCTRDLVNIRRDIVIVAGGSFVRTAGLRAQGEWVSVVDISPTAPPPGQFYAFSQVFANDGTPIPAFTTFATGFADNEVAPGIGETVALAVNSSVTFWFADEFQGRLPAGSTVSVDGEGVCELTISGGSTLLDNNGFGPSAVGINVRSVENPEADSVTSDITVTTPTGRVSGGSITCKAR